MNTDEPRAPERVLTPTVNAATDLSHAGVLTVAELATRVFRYGEPATGPGLRPGQQVAAMEHDALVYGHLLVRQIQTANPGVCAPARPEGVSAGG